MASEDGQLSVWENQVVKVIDDSRDDWTLVLGENGEGWVPKEYLRAQDGSETGEATNTVCKRTHMLACTQHTNMCVYTSTNAQTTSNKQTQSEGTCTQTNVL